MTTFADSNAIPDWDAAETYEPGDIVRCSDGSIYVATDEHHNDRGERQGWRLLGPLGGTRPLTP